MNADRLSPVSGTDMATQRRARFDPFFRSRVESYRDVCGEPRADCYGVCAIRDACRDRGWGRRRGPSGWLRSSRRRFDLTLVGCRVPTLFNYCDRTSLAFHDDFATNRAHVSSVFARSVHDSLRIGPIVRSSRGRRVPDYDRKSTPNVYAFQERLQRCQNLSSQYSCRIRHIDLRQLPAPRVIFRLPNVYEGCARLCALGRMKVDQAVPVSVEGQFSHWNLIAIKAELVAVKLSLLNTERVFCDVHAQVCSFLSRTL